jgi:hypothetical protein
MADIGAEHDGIRAAASEALLIQAVGKDFHVDTPADDRLVLFVRVLDDEWLVFVFIRPALLELAADAVVTVAVDRLQAALHSGIAGRIPGSKLPPAKWLARRTLLGFDPPSFPARIEPLFLVDCAQREQKDGEKRHVETKQSSSNLGDFLNHSTVQPNVEVVRNLNVGVRFWGFGPPSVRGESKVAINIDGFFNRICLQDRCKLEGLSSSNVMG